MWRIPRSLRSLATCLLLTASLLSSSGAVIKDPSSPADSWLDVLAGDLDRQGIDVRRRWTDLTLPDPERPQLSRLGGYPAKTRPFVDESWMVDFAQGVKDRPALLAVEDGAEATGPVRLGPQQFESLWDGVEPSRRVFISYTRTDAAAARAIRDTLEARGHVVFVYRESATSPPEFSARTVGKFFRTAHHHLVIDTPAARSSMGVALEAHTYRAIEAQRARAATQEAETKVGAVQGSADEGAVGSGPPKPKRAQLPPDLVLDPFRSGHGKGGPCCEECTVVNGVKTGCTFLGCGAVCAAAQVPSL